MTAYQAMEIVNGSGASSMCPAICLGVGADLSQRGGTCDEPGDGGAEDGSDDGGEDGASDGEAPDGEAPETGGADAADASGRSKDAG